MINLYPDKDIKLIRKSGEILAFVLGQLVKETKIGVTGIDLDQRARKLIEEMGGKPSFLGYRKFPAALCVSVNNQLVHGIPSDKPFKKGDIISLDLGISYRGYFADKAITLLLDDNDKKKIRFIKTTKKSLEKGIAKAGAGVKLGVVSNTIQQVIEKGGYKVIRELSGHGIGRALHEDPRIFNFGSQYEGPILKEGMVFAIEPMACFGTSGITVDKDGHTILSKDGSWCAHFEETVAITKNGPIILTALR